MSSHSIAVGVRQGDRVGVDGDRPSAVAIAALSRRERLPW